MNKMLVLHELKNVLKRYKIMCENYLIFNEYFDYVLGATRGYEYAGDIIIEMHFKSHGLTYDEYLRLSRVWYKVIENTKNNLLKKKP